jgi:hypothetical protein
MKPINRTDDRPTRQTKTTGSIILASLIRTFKGALGLWCIVGPLTPFIFLDSNPIAAIVLSIGVAAIIFGLIIWKYRTGSAAIIGALLRDTGLGLLFSLLGGITVAVLLGVNIGGGILVVTWGCFFILEWRNRPAAPSLPKAA